MGQYSVLALAAMASVVSRTQSLPIKTHKVNNFELVTKTSELHESVLKTENFTKVNNVFL